MSGRWWPPRPGQLTRPARGRFNRTGSELGTSSGAATNRTLETRPAAWLARAASQPWLAVSACVTGLVVLFVRLLGLDGLQNEFYGDISIVLEYVRNIQAGSWPLNFDLSSGPLYHYLIIPVIALTGRTYFGFKLASIILSLGVLAVTYALSRRLLGDWFALLVTIIAGTSSWLLTFSRLGNSQILVPLLATGALWLAVRFAQEGRRSDLLASALVSALGLYVYPQSFILPLVTFLTLLCLRGVNPDPERRIRWSDLEAFVQVTIVGALPFAWIVARNLNSFETGYIGSKLSTHASPLALLLSNTWHALLAFHVRGDGIFRSNPVGLPHLDPLSGLFMLGGIVFWLFPARRARTVLLVPLVLLQVPSILVLSAPQEIPSASRTLGAAPIVYVLVASGLWWMLQVLLWRTRRLGLAVTTVMLSGILLLNANRYFVQYLGALPYHNTPVAHLVAGYIDSLAPDTQVYVAGCCWHDGMPEPKSIQYAMAGPTNFHPIPTPDELTCDQLRSFRQPAVLIWTDQKRIPTLKLADCEPWLQAQTHYSTGGLPVFRAAVLRPDLTTVSDGTAPGPGGMELPTAAVQVNGQSVTARYSQLDIGQIGNLFDGDPHSLVRGARDNPFVLELRFARPVTATLLSLTFGTVRLMRVQVTLAYSGGGRARVSRDFHDLPLNPQVDLPIPGVQPIETVHIEIEDLGPTSDSAYHIHLRELELH